MFEKRGERKSRSIHRLVKRKNENIKFSKYYKILIIVWIRIKKEVRDMTFEKFLKLTCNYFHSAAEQYASYGVVSKSIQIGEFAVFTIFWNGEEASFSPTSVDEDEDPEQYANEIIDELLYHIGNHAQKITH